MEDSKGRDAVLSYFTASSNLRNTAEIHHNPLFILQIQP